MLSPISSETLDIFFMDIRELTRLIKAKTIDDLMQKNRINSIVYIG